MVRSGCWGVCEGGEGGVGGRGEVVCATAVAALETAENMMVFAKPSGARTETY